MAFPYLSECGFEDGTLGHFDAETDTENRLDFAHFSTLARTPGIAMPYRGAYCCRVTLVNDGSPADAYLQETGSWDTATSGTIYFRFFFWLGANPVMANADEFAILQLWSSTNTVEAGVYINYTTANGFRIGIGETAATSFKALELNKWHCLEIKATIDSGANNGTLDAWLDGNAFTQVASLTQGAITSGVIGILGQDAGTTTGLLLIDDVIADDGRIGFVAERFPTQITVTQSGHLFVGPGSIDAAALVSTTAGNIMQLYDTDTAYTTDLQSFVCEIAVGANQAFGGPIQFKRGCYAVLTGTNPRGQVILTTHDRVHDAFGPVYYSEGMIRRYGIMRDIRPQNI